MNKRRLLAYLKAAVAVALLWLVYGRIDLGGFLRDIASVRPLPLVVFAGLLVLNTAISAAKWRILLLADGVAVPFPRLFGSYLIGSFFNLFLPSVVGGDVYRVYSLGPGAKMAKSFTAVLFDRLSGFIALAFLGLTAAAIEFEPRADRRFILTPLIAFAVLICGAWCLFHRPLAMFALRVSGLGRIPALARFAGKCLDSVEQYKRNPAVVAQAMALSFLFQFAVVVCIWLLGRALSLPIRFLNYMVFVPIISFMEAVPISIYGLGLRDAGYMMFFTEAGMADPKANALSMSMLYIGLTVLYASCGGWLFLYRAYFSRPPEDETRAARRCRTSERSPRDIPL